MELLLGAVVLGAIVGGGVLWQNHVAERDPSPWQALAEASGLGRAAREPLLVRERLGGIDPGRLSLAGGAEGQLALADDVAGRVTLDPPDRS